MKCAPEDVFRVLDDGWFFCIWVVGASRMRDVDASWPVTGSKLEHSFGAWPLLINDSTTVLEHTPKQRMVLQAKGWPIGEARVAIDVRPHPRGCIVRMEEYPVTGPATLVPKLLLDAVLHIRNIEALRRLSYIAEKREWDQTT